MATLTPPTNETSPTRMAILRTMGNLHTEPLQYDLDSLRTLILRLAPDLLCADLTRAAWERGNLSGAPLEVQEVLAPVTTLTDTVLVPVAPTSQQFADFHAPPGWRHWASQRFDRMLQWGQRRANTPEAIHGPAFEAYCHTICALEEMTWTKANREAYAARTSALADNILAAVARDPGVRTLVIVQCQWHHVLEPLLKEKAPGLEIVDYREL